MYSPVAQSESTWLGDSHMVKIIDHHPKVSGSFCGRDQDLPTLDSDVMMDGLRLEA